jgi:uncharacterized membrane protein YeaQ/YmgE (transglycosylase-associated protein family)
MTASALLVALIIGAAAGWLAGQLVQGTGFGLVGDIVVGTGLDRRRALSTTRHWAYAWRGLIGAIVAATIGAVILLLIVRLVKGAMG